MRSTAAQPVPSATHRIKQRNGRQQVTIFEIRAREILAVDLVRYNGDKELMLANYLKLAATRQSPPRALLFCIDILKKDLAH